MFLINHYTVNPTYLKTTAKLALENDKGPVHDFRLPPRCKEDFHSSGMLCSLYCSCRTAWPLKTGPIGCAETSVNNYQSTLRNITEKRRYTIRLRYIL